MLFCVIIYYRIISKELNIDPRVMSVSVRTSTQRNALRAVCIVCIACKLDTTVAYYCEMRAVLQKLHDVERRKKRYFNMLFILRRKLNGHQYQCTNSTASIAECRIYSCKIRLNDM